jgi:hypothetical protein
VVPNHIAFGYAFGKTVPLEKLGRTDVTANFDDVFESELGEPITVLFDSNQIKIHYFAHLLFPGLDIGINFFLGNEFAASIAL